MICLPHCPHWPHLTLTAEICQTTSRQCQSTVNKNRINFYLPRFCIEFYWKVPEIIMFLWSYMKVTNYWSKYLLSSPDNGHKSPAVAVYSFDLLKVTDTRRSSVRVVTVRRLHGSTCSRCLTSTQDERTNRFWETEADLRKGYRGCGKCGWSEEGFQPTRPLHPGQGQECRDSQGLLLRAGSHSPGPPGIALDSYATILLWKRPQGKLIIFIK